MVLQMSGGVHFGDHRVGKHGHARHYSVQLVYLGLLLDGLLFALYLATVHERTEAEYFNKLFGIRAKLVRCVR